MSARRILMLGPPGAGKGTQAQRLAKDCGIAHVSTGDMLRSAVAAGSEVGKRARAVMDAGRLVSDEIVIAIAEERLREGDCAAGFVLDGFPRTLPQAEALDELLKRLGTPLECCLALRVDPEALVERLLKRAQIEGRSDDNADTIRQRMAVYEEQTAPLIEHYRALLREVDGMGTIDAVSRRVREAVDAQ
jgi:adenylate kinase